MLCSLLVSGHDFKNNVHYMNIGGLSWVMAYFSAITLIFFYSTHNYENLCKKINLDTLMSFSFRI